MLTVATLAACSGTSSESGTTENDDPPASPSQSAAAPFPTEQAQDAAQASLLELGDFPAGWSTSENEDNGDDETKFQEQLASCLNLPADTFSDDLPDAAHADTPDYDSPDGNQSVSEGVTVTTAERVTALMDALAGTSATNCLGTTLNDYMHDVFENTDDPDIQQAELGTIEVGQVSFPSYGEQTVAMRAEIPFSVSGFNASVYIDMIFIQESTGVALLTFFDQSSPFDVSQMQHYAKVAAQKLEAADLPTGR